MSPADTALAVPGIIAASAVLGLLIGSFLNVVIYRVPAGKSIVSPASACPNCDAPIRRRDNIPVLSWLLLRGKCRNCAAPISVRYPLVEAATSALFVITALRFVGGVVESSGTQQTLMAVIVLVAYLYLAGIAIALVAIDIDTHTLPNAIVFPSYVVAAVLLVAASLIGGDWFPLLRAAAGMGILFVAYFVMAFAYPGGMGLGDVKLAGVLGLYLGWLGWGSLIVGGFSAFLLGGIFSAVLLISRRANRRSGIPFGPWMVAGTYVGILFGEQLWTGYLGLVGLA